MQLTAAVAKNWVLLSLWANESAGQREQNMLPLLKLAQNTRCSNIQNEMLQSDRLHAYFWESNLSA